MDELKTLRSALEALADRMTTCAERLTSAAEELMNGRPAAEELITDLTALRSEFCALQSDTIALAASAGHFPQVIPDSVGNLLTVLDAATSSPETWTTLTRAVNTLDRLLSLTYAGQELPALAPFQEQVFNLRQVILARDPDSEVVVTDLSTGTHPFAKLLHLAFDSGRLREDEWDTLFANVRRDCGFPLANAAARNSLREDPARLSEFLARIKQQEKPCSDVCSGIPADIDTPSDVGNAFDNIENHQLDVSSDEELPQEWVLQRSEEREPNQDVQHVELPENSLLTPGVSQDDNIHFVLSNPSQPPQEIASRQHSLAATDSAALAAAILSDSRPLSEQLPDLTVLIFRLLGEGRAGLAYHLARNINEFLPPAQQGLPAWITRAVALGRHLRLPVGDVERLLKEDFSQFGDHCFREGDSDWNHAVRFLLAAAALQPALLAPDTGAPAVLHALRLKEGLNSMYEYCQHVAIYGDQMNPLDPGALKGANDEAAWQGEMDTLRRQVESWRARAESFTAPYGPANRVWWAWLEPQGQIGRILRPVQSQDKSLMVEATEILEHLSLETSIRRAVYETDRNTLRRRGGDDITSSSMSMLIQHTREALDFLRRWVTLHEARPGQSSHRQQQALQIRQRVWSLHSDVVAELDAFSNDHQDPMIIASINCVRRVLEHVKLLFDPRYDLPSDEPDSRHILHADLLRIPELALTDEWEPDGVNGLEVARKILKLVASADWDWSDAFSCRASEQDHEATGRILEFLEAFQGLGVDLTTLRQSRERKLKECREALTRQILITQNEVENAVVFGLLSESDRNKYASDISAMEVALPNIVRFGPRSAELKYISDHIKHRRQEEIQAALHRLEATGLRPDTEDYERIVRVLDQGDMLTANEYVERVRSGEPLPEAEPDRTAFQDFFPERVIQLDGYLNENPGAQIIRCLKQRQIIPAIDLSEIEDSQLEASVEMLDAWFAVKASGNCEVEQATALLTHLGFRPRQISTIRQANRRAWLDLLTEPLRDKLTCPVAYYGSEAGGHYRILCVWDRPSEEDLLSEVGDTSHSAPVIVWYFGRLNDKRRRDLARLCRERRRTVLVIDDTLVLYLCTLRGARLPVMFSCTLPFTFLEPYTTAAGVVPPEVFYGRERERDAIIARTTGTCFIYGGRQLGKTALLRDVARTFHQPANGQIALWLDLKFEGLGLYRPADEIWSLIISPLKVLQVLPTQLPAHTDPQRIFSWIRKWLDDDQRRRILLLLDEADRFLELDGHDRFRRTELIKGWMDITDRRFKVVFAGLHNVQRTTRLSNHPLAHYGDPVCIGPMLQNMEWRAAQELIERPLAALGYRFADRQLVTRILSQTNYYPSLIQLYCSHLLRHVSNPRSVAFDPRTSPPYTITAEHVEEAYRSQELRKAIRDRFLWTLQLDERYEVIAYAISYECLLEQGERRGLIDGLPVSTIRRAALVWWPEGFGDGAPEDAFRVLLDEMVGLGVLQVSREGRYTLRSPNILPLMGTIDEVESQLLRTREMPREYEPDTFRRVIRSGSTADLSQRSPLTAQQEAGLHSNQNGVSLVFGTEAAGLGSLGDALVTAFGIEFSTVLKGATEKRAFSLALDELSYRQRDGVTLLYVPHSCPWSEYWVTEAVDRLAKLKSRNASVRVVFAVDAQTTWHLTEHHPSGLELLASKGVTTFSLRPWHDHATRQWLDDCGFAQLELADRQQIYNVTGRWQLFLHRFLVQCRNKPHRWKEALLQLDAHLSDRKTREEWLANLGIAKSEAFDTLQSLALLDKATPSELASVMDKTTMESVTRVLKWGEKLNLCRQLDGQHWIVDDPLLRRLLAVEN